jgi:hypothetical protein
METTTGDIGFVTNPVMVSNLTKFFLQINRIRLGRPVKKDKIFGHVFTIAEKDGEKYVCESIKGGWIVELYPGQYAGRESEIEWKTPSTPWTEQQKAAFTQECFDFREKRKAYDVPGYLLQFFFTLIGWWFGPTGRRAEKKITCAEAIPTIVNNAFNEDIFECNYLMNPFLLYIDSYYKEKK